MMNDSQKFLFDLQGYIVLEGVLDADRLERMCRNLDAHSIAAPDDGSNASRFGQHLTWGDDWRNLIDEPRVMDVLDEIIGTKFRLDHTYGMAMKADANVQGPGDLHHEGGMFGHGCFYAHQKDKMHNGLTVVGFALTDVEAGAGGFHCIPGSHKSHYPMPREFYDVADNPIIKHVPMKAGDVLIFTEALTHGTAAWKGKGERRSVLLKYCPHYMQWAKNLINDEIEGLTDRQRLILGGAYVPEHPVVAEV